MNVGFLKSLLVSLVLLVVQVMVLNHIHLFRCATPMLLVYAVVLFPLTTPRWASLLLSFLIGMVSDIFTNTPGVVTMTLTFIAFIQPSLLRSVLPQEAAENAEPSLKNLGWKKYVLYSGTLTIAYCLLVVVLENFAFSRLLWMGENIIGSVLLTYLLIVAIENIRKV